MEVKNVSVICLVLACVIFNSVQSASFYYRTGREIEIPVENEIIREEIVSELKREPEITAIETEPIAAIIKEEVIIPVETLRIAAPAVEVQEPVAIISGKEETNAVIEESVALRSAAAESIVPVVVEENIVSVPIVEEPVAVAEVKEDTPVTRNEPLVEVIEKIIDPVPEVQTEVKEAPIEVVHVAVKSNPIEAAVVEEQENVVVPDTPAYNAEEAIRQSEGAPAASATTAAPATPTRPGVIQALQHQFQNFQTQIQNAFNQNAANTATADSTAPVTTRPGLIAQVQQNVGQFFNRPAGSQGPLQGFVSAVQNNIQTAQTNFQGLFRPNASPAASPPGQTSVVPVVVAPADPVAEKTMLEEVPVVNENIEVVEKVEEKADDVKSD